MDKLNKKAVVFTFITVTLLFILIMAFLININNRSNTKIQTTNVKVETLNSFVKNLNSSLIPDAMRASANQAMFSLLDYESNQTETLGTSFYMNDLEDYFRQVMIDGKYNGELQENMFQEGLDFTLTSTLNEVETLASEQGAVFTSIPDYDTIILEQRNPWHVIVSMEFDYTLSDVKNEITWNIQNRRILSVLDIENYRDPFYLIQQEARKSVNIVKTPYTNFNNMNHFNDHIEKSYFIENPDAPTFLDRLRGEFVPITIYGIESVLNPAIYSNPLGYSNVDHMFFTQVPGVCIQGMPSNFKLDNSHILYYNRVAC